MLLTVVQMVLLTKISTCQINQILLAKKTHTWLCHWTCHCWTSKKSYCYFSRNRSIQNRMPYLSYHHNTENIWIFTSLVNNCLLCKFFKSCELNHASTPAPFKSLISLLLYLKVLHPKLGDKALIQFTSFIENCIKKSWKCIII